MRKSEVNKAVQAHIEPILQRIAEGQLVEIVLPVTDEEAQAQGWPSVKAMVLGIQELQEALPDSLRKYLRVISKDG